MKDHLDKQTQLLPLEPKRERGRPATGQALSNAERQRAYRERQKAQRNVTGKEATTGEVEKLREMARAEFKRAEGLQAQVIDMSMKIAQLEHEIRQLKKSGVFHCYTSNLQLAEYALAQDFKLGFNGVVTFKAAENVREILTMTPVNSILLETDAPFLAPLPYRSQENAPKYLPWVVKKIAEVKKIDPEELLATIYCNTTKLFELN